MPFRALATDVIELPEDFRDMLVELHDAEAGPHEWRAHPLAEVERMLAGETGTPSDIVLGAFEPSLCGHVGLRRQLRRKRAHRATLWGMYVAPEVRGRGIGGRLLQALLDHARSQPDLIIIELTVMSDNQHAVRLYRRFGFQRFGYQPRHQGRQQLLRRGASDVGSRRAACRRIVRVNRPLLAVV